MLRDVIERRLEQPNLFRPTHGWNQEDDARMQFDVAITAAELDSVVGHQNPVALGNNPELDFIELRGVGECVCCAVP